MNIEKAIKRYIETVESDAFASYEKDFARRITSALSECYQQRLGETDRVKIIESVINSCKNLTIKSNQPYFELSTNVIFIHGYPKKSGVEFGYYGKSAYTELGDIIFIVSIIFNGQRYFEKFTINQFKKDIQRTRTISWDIKNKEQLYLLSRFPRFKGVVGSIVPQKDFNLPNYSGCLGSYGLLYNPGDFSFVSGTRLDSYLGSSKKINGNDIFLMRERREDRIEIREWHHFLHERVHILCKHICGPRCDICCHLYPFLMFIGNCHFAGNVFDFVDKYLRLCIGEPTDMKIGKKNVNARKFLCKLLSAIRIKAKRDGLDEVLKFANDFFKYRFSDNEGEGEYRNNIEAGFEGGGIGIIHTMINLGE